MKGVKERLIKFITYLDRGGQTWFEDYIGLSRGYVSNIGDSIRSKSIEKIRKHFPDLNPAWLLTGEGTMLLGDKSQTIKKENKGLPVYESSPMTLSNIESYRDEHQQEPDFYLNIPQYRNCDFATRAKGDSMHPVIRNMALVGGRRIYDFSVIIFGDIYIIQTKNNIETIKYIHPDPDNPENVLLVPYNGNAKTTPIHKSEILKIYQAQFVLNPL